MATTNEIEQAASAAAYDGSTETILKYEQIRATLAVADAINALTRALVDKDGQVNIWVGGGGLRVSESD